MVGESVEYWRGMHLTDLAEVKNGRKGHYLLQVSGITVVGTRGSVFGASYLDLSLVWSNGEKLRCSLSLRMGKLPSNEKSIAAVLNKNSGKDLESIVGIRLGDTVVNKSVGYLKFGNIEAVIESGRVVFY